MPRYSNDPYWLTAKFQSACSKKNCGAIINKGDRAFYYPSERACYCQKDECGGEASRDFEALAQDEAFMTGNY